MNYNGGSLKNQMRKANKLNSAQVIIIGEDELSKGVVVMRDMKDKTQSDVLITEVINRLRK